MVKKSLFVAVFFALPVVSLAQSIPIKTIPVATGDQFMLFPSRNSSMAGVSIALEDPWLDPFVNPAKGAFVEGMQLLTSPVFYGISFDRSNAEASGSTLPLGLLMKNETFFGGLLWARQQLTNERSSFVMPAFVRPPSVVVSNEASTPKNNYTFVMGGKKFSGSDISIGASIFWADLNAIEGVQHLYASSSDIRQSGALAEYRVGLFAPLDDGKSLEFLLLHHRFKMTHDVAYNFTWNGGTWSPQPRVERNIDETTGWAARVGYREPLGNTWSMGLQATANWKWHPKIPNYELMNIPRDPGNSSAYNLGIGFSARGEKGIFSVEYIIEPIWSNTWADADRVIQTAGGGAILPGGKTVENFFRFWNSVFRFGFHRGEGLAGFDIGFQVHSINYELNQQDFVNGFKRTQDESWDEWTVTGGFTITFPGVIARYGGILTTGTGQPGVGSGFGLAQGARDALAYSDFIPAPSGRLTLDEAWILTHQVSVIVQIH